MNKGNTGGLNVLQRAARAQANFAAEMEYLSGYKVFTTFYADLTIAEAYGLDAVRETFDRVNRDWRDNYRYYTEFVLALNHKIWEHYQNNDELARLYDELWRKADTFAAQWEGEAAEYYFNVTD